MVRNLAKTAVQGLALLFAVPSLISFHLKARVIGRDDALHGSTQWLALIPGRPGRFVRVMFLRYALRECATSAAIEFGTIFSKADARIGENVYIGPHCHIGLAVIERDVLLAAGVHVPSGPNTHGTARLDIPIREQPGTPVVVRIAEGSWIGSASVVMADVGAHSIVGAGSVVTKPVAPFSFAAGVPARVIKDRRAEAVPHEWAARNVGMA